MKELHNLSIPALFALSCLPLLADTFGSGTNQFTIEFVEVGDVGNPNDSGTTGSYYTDHGGVDYVFRMGVYEVSRDLITKANVVGGLGLTMWDMTDLGGNVGTHPATGITWNEAARFVNWLNVSSGYLPAYKFNTQPGDVGYNPEADIILVWSPSDVGYDAENLYRNTEAFYFLPSEDEWYKAAFYSGSGSTYYDYATQQDSPNAPTSVAGGTMSGTAVYSQPTAQGPSGVEEAGGFSFYGTRGQAGNVGEWMEGSYDGVNNFPREMRVTRGGDWNDSEQLIRSSNRMPESVFFQNINIGFRVAGSYPIPEPTIPSLLWLGLLALFLARQRQPR